MARYKFAGAHEWFAQWLGRQTDVHGIAAILAEKVDSDTLQDLFEKDMTSDGYFRDLDKTVAALHEVHHGEATGRTYWFCSDRCREEFACGIDDGTLASGDSNEFVDGEVCSECGDVLE